MYSPPRGLDEARDNLAAVAARFFAGQDLDGIQGTDATFLRHGRRIVAKNLDAPVRRSSYRAGWHRLTVRTAALAAAAGSAYAYLTHPGTVTQALIYGAPAAVLAPAAGGAVWSRAGSGASCWGSGQSPCTRHSPTRSGSPSTPTRPPISTCRSTSPTTPRSVSTSRRT
ncbi:hypothetical protein [Streptomyces sp. NPDC058758]|uniref:hypothetical protein n=1 Tax=Streptomyces sp. NPDC058758 TaxID=3346627 RepID=UPI0036B11353